MRCRLIVMVIPALRRGLIGQLFGRRNRTNAVRSFEKQPHCGHIIYRSQELFFERFAKIGIAKIGAKIPGELAVRLIRTTDIHLCNLENIRYS